MRGHMRRLTRRDRTARLVSARAGNEIPESDKSDSTAQDLTAVRVCALITVYAVVLEPINVMEYVAPSRA